MDFIKKWIWGKETSEEPEQNNSRPPQYRSQPRGDLKGSATSATVKRLGQQPLLREVAHGSVQGLDWYQSKLLEDTDGDCAEDFLEESDAKHRSEAAAVLKKGRPTSCNDTPPGQQLQSRKKDCAPASRVKSLSVNRGHVTTNET